MPDPTPNNKNGKTWKIFIWAMGIILILFGTVFTLINATNGRVDRQLENTAAMIDGQNMKIETYGKDLSEVKGDVKQIRTDIEWIKKVLTK